jgi:hypothetical protein
MPALQLSQAAAGDERGPILIGGLDRSGKTLLRLSLSAHPNIAMSRRTYMWTHFYGRYGDLKKTANFERCLAAMLKHKPMRALQPDAERIRREFAQGEPTYARLFAIFHGHYAERVGKPRWGDQLGFIERYADPIFAAYPGARMIHMVRDPRDQYAAATPPAERRAGKAGAAVARWRSSLALAERNQRRYPDRYKIVRYEVLVGNCERALRDICAFVGEAFVPEMLTLEGAMRFGEERGDADETRAGSPAPLAPREMAFIERFAAREMASLAYPPIPVRLARAERLAYALVDWPINLARAAAWEVLEALQHRTPPQVGRRVAFRSMK